MRLWLTNNMIDSGPYHHKSMSKITDHYTKLLFGCHLGLRYLHMWLLSMSGLALRYRPLPVLPVPCIDLNLKLADTTIRNSRIGISVTVRYPRCLAALGTSYPIKYLSE